MIKIKRNSGSITLEGHAGYAPQGQDVVCAAVSTLVQAFYLSARELTQDEIKADFRPGNAVIQHGNLSESGKLLVDSLFVGLKMIADNYPEHVRVL